MLKILAGNAKDEHGDNIQPSISNKGAHNVTGWIARENSRSEQYPLVILERGKHAGYSIGLPFFCYWFDIVETKGLKHKQLRGPIVKKGDDRNGYLAWFEDVFLKLDKQTTVDALEKAFVKS